MRTHSRPDDAFCACASIQSRETRPEDHGALEHARRRRLSGAWSTHVDHCYRGCVLFFRRRVSAVETVSRTSAASLTSEALFHFLSAVTWSRW